MRTRSPQKVRIIQYLLLIYIILALSWWATLLIRETNHHYELRHQIMAAQYYQQHPGATAEDYEASDICAALNNKHQRKQLMIYSESAVLWLILAILIFYLSRIFNNALRSAQAQRNFLLSITHELKSPLAGIQLSLEALQHPRLKQEQRQRLSQSALQETERLHDLISDLLLSARLDTSYQAQPEAMDLRATYQDVVDKLQHKYPTAQFLWSGPATVPLYFDRLGLQSLLGNLLENGVKYSPAPAQVTTNWSVIGDQAFLRVQDEGYGIPVEERQRIFKKFYRIGNEDTRKTTGTGLGLHIVHSIVRAHGGQIRVLDHPPSGTVMEVQFPLGRLRTPTRTENGTAAFPSIE